MQGKKHFNEKLFLSFQLTDRVPVENFYRRLRNQLDLHWLYKATSKYYGVEGQQSIDPIVFFMDTPRYQWENSPFHCTSDY